MTTEEVAPKTEGEVVATYEEALAAGYYGEKVDPLPNSAYTVTGSVARAKESEEERREPSPSAMVSWEAA